jgi:hypothetical protein
MALDLEEQTGSIIGAAIEVHRALGPGFIESVYETALVVELRHRNIPFVVHGADRVSGRRGRAPPARPLRLGSGRRRAEGSPRVHARALRGVEVLSSCRRPGAWSALELCEGRARDQARAEPSAPRVMSDSLFLVSCLPWRIVPTRPSQLDRRIEQVRRAPGVAVRDGLAALSGAGLGPRMDPHPPELP